MELIKEQQYSVWHAREEIIFTGTRIAHSSTETPQQLRWIEIDIYRTKGGRYVIHRIGVSLVYHEHNGTTCADTGVAMRFGHLKPDAEPCTTCKPPLNADPEFVVDTETDRHTAVVCDAGSVQDHLMVRPQNGSPFLSSPARKALDQAVTADPVLSDMLRKKVRIVE